jgi:hypothetical protein
MEIKIKLNSKRIKRKGGLTWNLNMRYFKIPLCRNSTENQRSIRVMRHMNVGSIDTCQWYLRSKKWGMTAANTNTQQSPPLVNFWLKQINANTSDVTITVTFMALYSFVPTVLLFISAIPWVTLLPISVQSDVLPITSGSVV